MGYDFAGEVVQLGEHAQGFALGDTVFGMVEAWRAGALAEYLCSKTDELALKPEALAWEDAAALPLAALTALQALRDVAGLKPGEHVLINGASGGVGVCAVQIAKALGAHVTATSSPGNRQLVEELGCDRWLDYGVDDIFAERGRYAVIFDAFGDRSYTAARPALSARGRYVSTVPSLRLMLDVARTSGCRQRAGMVIVHSRKRDLIDLTKLIGAGQLRAVIDSVHPLTDIVSAQTRLETKRARGKVVLRVA
jgi:NADPH:quinone reductase-like Zn-dependent oxidoreductase